MVKRSDIKVGVQLAVDAPQQIEIEFRRDAGGIVIGWNQNVGVLF